MATGTLVPATAVQVVLVVALLGGLDTAARAGPGRRSQDARGPEARPDLAESVARRLSRSLGVAVSIGSLQYRILESTFVGREVKIGPASRPSLELDRLRVKVKVSLLGGGGGRTAQAIEVSGLRVDLPLRSLGEPLSTGRQGSVAFEVERVRLRQGRLELRAKRGGRVLLDGIEIRAVGVAGERAAAGRLPALAGSIRASIARVELGELVLDNVRIAGALRAKSRTLQIDELTFDGFGGSMQLTGAVRLGRRRPAERIALSGKATVRPQGQQRTFTGKIGVQGRRGRGVSISGRLAPDRPGPPLPPERGSVGALPIQGRLRVSLGRRVLGGTLAGWRLR